MYHSATNTASFSEGRKMEVKELLNKVREYLSEDKLPLIEKACDFAAQAHEGQRRLSGEPFLEHPLQTAMTLADLQLDASAIAAGVLHDVPEDCGVPLKTIAAG